MGSLNFLIIILGIIISYLIGSINFAIIIGKYFFNKDPRNYHSKNAGATNAVRVLGVKWGGIVFLLDMIKIPICLVIIWGLSFIQGLSGRIDGHIPYYPITIATLVGHNFPVFYKFKGGKGVSCFIGLTWMINPYFFIVFAGIWWSLFFIFRRVSVSSLAACIAVMIVCWIPQLSGLSSLNASTSQTLNSNLLWFNQAHRLATGSAYSDHIIYTINIVIMVFGLMSFWRHQSNIYRILHKTEQKLVLSKHTP